MDIQKFLGEKQVVFNLLPHRESFDAQRMAQTLHVPGREVAKTVLLRADRGYAYFVAVVPAPEHIDLPRVAELLGGSQVELASEEELAARCPDCECGVLPPFGSEYGMQTLLDSQLLDDEEIVFEGNTHHEAIRMKMADFRRLEQPLEGRLTTRKA